VAQGGYLPRSATRGPSGIAEGGADGARLEDNRLLARYADGKKESVHTEKGDAADAVGKVVPYQVDVTHTG
jgi:hypothetical protein